MNADLKSWLPTLIFVPLVAFALYRRTRAAFGKQRVNKTAMTLRLVLLAAVGVLLAATARTPEGLFGAGLGLLLGLALAWVGLKRTHLEVTPGGTFYTANKWIGLGVMALFLGRFGARLLSTYQAAAQPSASFAGFDSQRSPLTTGFFFLMAGYYALFYAGVLWKLREARPLSATTPAVRDGSTP